MVRRRGGQAGREAMRRGAALKAVRLEEGKVKATTRINRHDEV